MGLQLLYLVKITPMRKALLLFLLSIAVKTVFAQDTIPPVISLKGNDTVLLGVMNQWVDPGVTVTDNVDTALAQDTAGTFYDTFADGYADDLGTYTILYRTKDKAGNKDSVMRTVVVKDTIPTRSYFYHQVFLHSQCPRYMGRQFIQCQRRI